jgi:hypothetical protein
MRSGGTRAVTACSAKPLTLRGDSHQQGLQLALAWLATGALLGALLLVLGVAVIAAFNAFYWLPIRGESARPRP